LRENENIVDCAVIGIKDEEWGEKIAVFFVAKQKQNIEDLKKWAKTLLAPYKVPTIWKEVKELPKNAMGKVLKNELH
jgi:malonyl-CoA/methylmalonyl-CoA synthetase